MPFVRGAHLRSHATRPYTFSNSPVNGLLYVRGTIGRLPALQGLLPSFAAMNIFWGSHWIVRHLQIAYRLRAITEESVKPTHHTGQTASAPIGSWHLSQSLDVTCRWQRCSARGRGGGAAV